MSISREHAMIIARETLKRNLNKYGITIEHIRSGGADELIRSAAWSTGIEIETDSGEVWSPSTQHLLPGCANYDAAVQAEKEGRLTFTASDEKRFAYLLDEAPKYKFSFEACKYVLSKFLEQRSHIPSPLVEFGAKVLRNEILEPKEQGGAVGTKDLGRACLVETIYEVVETTGLKATGNDATKDPHNAAHYVANAACISIPKAKKAWEEAKPKDLQKPPFKEKQEKHRYITIRLPRG